MKRVKCTNKIPEGSIISKGFGNYHYCDSYRIETQSNASLDNTTTDIFKTPKWADALMGIRNTVARLVGLQAGGYKKDNYISDYYPVGSRAVYFTVIDRTDNEIVMAERDKHLDFRVSVLIDRKTDKTTINLTTLVKYNNGLGRLYFLPVKPFHRIIVMSLLKRLPRSVSDG
jgi:hypothetical protein